MIQLPECSESACKFDADSLKRMRTDAGVTQGRADEKESNYEWHEMAIKNRQWIWLEGRLERFGMGNLC